MASKLYEILRKDVFSDIETGPRLLSLTVIKENIVTHEHLHIITSLCRQPSEKYPALMGSKTWLACDTVKLLYVHLVWWFLVFLWTLLWVANDVYEIKRSYNLNNDLTHDAIWPKWHLPSYQCSVKCSCVFPFTMMNNMANSFSIALFDLVCSSLIHLT